MKLATSFARRFLDSLRTGFVLSKTVFFIFGLVLSYALVQKAVVDVFIDFLMYGLELRLRNAIVLTNMLDLISALFKVCVVHISEGYSGPFNVIIFCTSAYTMGLMLLWFHTSWLILAMVLVALGKATEQPCLTDFFDHQLSEKVKKKCTQHYKREDKRNSSSEEINLGGTGNYNLWSVTASLTGATIAIFWLGEKSEIQWSEKLKVLSLVMGSTYFLYFFGIFCYYPQERSLGSPFTTIFRVFSAAIQKRRFPYPSSKDGYYQSDDHNSTQDSNQSEARLTGSPLITTINRVLKAAEQKRTLPSPFSVDGYSSSHSNSEGSNDLNGPFYRKENGEVHLLPRDPSFLLFLDKAAIINRKNSDSDETKERNDEVFSSTVEQVRDVKSLYPLTILLEFTFFAYSLTFASRNTYFVLQTTKLNPNVGNFNVPVIAFFVLSSVVAFVVRTIQSITKLVKPTWSVAVGMFCSVLCCIAAWLVERERLSLIRKDPNKEIISLSIMVLTPQYVLLGLMQGFAEYGLGTVRVPESMIKFVEPCTKLMMSGIGNFTSVLFVLIFHSWIMNSMDETKLDVYFLMLASLNVVFFGIYVVLPSSSG